MFVWLYIDLSSLLLFIYIIYKYSNHMFKALLSTWHNLKTDDRDQESTAARGHIRDHQSAVVLLRILLLRANKA